MTLPVEAGQRLSPQDAYARALRGERCRILVDGRATALDVDRWLAEPSISDQEMLSACRGRTIDLGCGPGRLSAGLARAGVPSLGVDLEPEAVRLARRRGATALVRDLFGPMPGEGRWDTALLADVNLGIGGDPAVLLRRVSRLLAPGGALSLLVGQQHAAVVGRAMAGHFAQARELLDGVAQAGDHEHRFTADEVRALLAEAGFTLAEIHAVRVFTDLVPSALLDLEPGAVDGLLELERAVADRPEYLTLAAQIHAIATH